MVSVIRYRLAFNSESIPPMLEPCGVLFVGDPNQKTERHYTDPSRTISRIERTTRRSVKLSITAFQPMQIAYDRRNFPGSVTHFSANHIGFCRFGGSGRLPKHPLLRWPSFPRIDSSGMENDRSHLLEGVMISWKDPGLLHHDHAPELREMKDLKATACLQDARKALMGMLVSLETNCR